MRPKLKLAFMDTHDHIAQFFYSVLSSWYDIDVDYDNPEYLIFGDENFGTENKAVSRKDVTKIFYTGENRRPENYDCDYAISFDHKLSPWHYRMPLYMVYMWSLQEIHKTPYQFDYLINPEAKIAAPKTEFCSFVVSNPNCQERNDFFAKLHAVKPVASAGKYKKNVEAELNNELDKINFLKKYKFNICFESASHPGYVTEKLLHAYYAGTVPIYWGSPTILKDFNPVSMINVHEHKNFNSVIDEVLKIDADPDHYNAIANQPAFMYNIPPEYYILNNFLCWFDAIVNKRIDPRP